MPMLKLYKLLLFTVLLCLIAAMPLHAQKKEAKEPEKKEAEDDAKDAKAGKEEGGQDEEGEIVVNIKPGKKDAIFSSDGTVSYKLNVKSTYKKAQDGKLTCIVMTDDSKPVTEISKDFRIGSNGTRNVKFKFKAKEPGFYQVKFAFNLSFYDDTIKKVFGINPQDIKPTLHRPADFDVFWQRTLDTLRRIPPQYKITEDKNQSTDEMKVYLVEMHSWGNAIIKGWLTIPTKRTSRLPVRYRVPGYLVAMHPSFTEDDFAVFQLNVRGNGNAKSAINTNGLQYNLYNIQSREKYVYRAVYMDCMRGLDFIMSNAQQFGLDTGRVSLDGGSQGGALAVVVAALDHRIKCVTTEVPLYSDIRDASRITRLTPPKTNTPVYYLNNYVKTHPSFPFERLFRVWDYFDPMNFAQRVQCPVLMGIGLMDDLCPPSASFGMYNYLATEDKERWVSPDKGHEVDAIYYRFQYVWLREHLQLP